MIVRDLDIGRWRARFVFAQDGYDENAILDIMYDMDADDYLLVKAGRKMRKGRPNEGFTFTNDSTREALVVIGPTTSGRQFVNTLVHEVQHLAVAIAGSLGLNLKGEGPAYIIGDSAEELGDIVCRFGCPDCRE